MLVGEGHVVNRKKVQRLWREEGLRVPAKRRKRQRVGTSTTPAHRLAIVALAAAPATPLSRLVERFGLEPVPNMSVLQRTR